MGTAYLIVLARSVPIELKRPSLRAVREQAPKRETHFDAIDPAICGSGNRGSQDVNRKTDDDAVMLWKRAHRSAEIVRLEPHGLLRIHRFGVGRPTGIARVRLPS